MARAISIWLLIKLGSSELASSLMITFRMLGKNAKFYLFSAFMTFIS